MADLIKKPYFYDTKEGIDYFTKLMIDENPKKLSEKEKQDIRKDGQAMKKAALEGHIKEVKQHRNDDPSTYLSDPKQRGKILEIGKLEKDLAPKLTDLPIVKNNINRPRPVKRNYWDAYIKLNAGNKGPMKLPELTQEEIERAKRPSDWDVIYASMNPFEKGQWNAEQRRKKLKDQKEEAEEKKQQRIDNHTKQVWGIADKKPVTKEPLSTPETPEVKPIELPPLRVTPVSPEDTQSLDQRLKHSRSLPPGLSIELVKLQKEINRNVDYVLGADQKDSLESREKIPNNKEETDG